MGSSGTERCSVGGGGGWRWKEEVAVGWVVEGEVK